MRTIPSELIESHSRLGERLAELEHNAWRADLPENYVPLGKHAVFMPLRLTTAKRAELAMHILTTRIAILNLAIEMTAARSGTPDAWIGLEIDRLRQELRRIAWEWAPPERRDAAARGRQS